MKVAGKVITVNGGGDGIGRALVLELLGRGAAVASCPGRVQEVFGQVDGLVNVAGSIRPFVKLADLDDDAIEHVFAVNRYGTIHTTKALFPHLLERPVAHIANDSRMGGFLPVAGQTMYGASKAAVRPMSEGRRKGSGPSMTEPEDAHG